MLSTGEVHDPQTRKPCLQGGEVGERDLGGSGCLQFSEKSGNFAWKSNGTVIFPKIVDYLRSERYGGNFLTIWYSFQTFLLRESKGWSWFPFEKQNSDRINSVQERGINDSCHSYLNRRSELIWSEFYTSPPGALATLKVLRDMHARFGGGWGNCTRWFCV